MTIRYRDRKRKLGAIAEEAEGIQDRADAENRDATPAEAARIDALYDEFEAIEAMEPDEDYYAGLRLDLELSESELASPSRRRSH